MCAHALYATLHHAQMGATQPAAASHHAKRKMSEMGEVTAGDTPEGNSAEEYGMQQGQQPLWDRHPAESDGEGMAGDGLNR